MTKQKTLDDYLLQPDARREGVSEDRAVRSADFEVGEDDYIVDLHIHSHFSRATSSSMDLLGIVRGSKTKGLRLIGSGDALHPLWLKELKQTLKPAEGELFEYEGILMAPTAEINTVFTDGSANPHRIHQLLVFPTLSSAEALAQRLQRYGDLSADGRPTLSVDPPTLIDEANTVDQDIEVIPAHVWTPWFSLFGSNSGFNRVEECYGERSDRIRSLETGLSSDPEMNWMISRLDRYNLLSNSDAHSHHPWRLGREANVFTMKSPSYKGLLRTLRFGEGLKFTLEVPPEFGKYHWTGHRSCGVSMPPEEALKHRNICPVCGRRMTVGVEQRVYELADRRRGVKPEGKPGFIRILPLHELIMAVVGSDNYSSKKVQETYRALVSKHQTEYNVLLNVPIAQLEAFNRPLATLVEDMRSNRLKVEPGYDGVYGKLTLGDKSFSPASE